MFWVQPCCRTFQSKIEHRKEFGEEVEMRYRKLGSLIGGLAISAALVVSSGPRASANDDSRSRCRSRVEKADAHYRNELREHGKHSAKADEARGKLKEELERCWADDHSWYDPHHREWRTDRDWDRSYDWDHDRDHDRDRDDH
jgi:hypothetical protein